MGAVALTAASSSSSSSSSPSSSSIGLRRTARGADTFAATAAARRCSVPGERCSEEDEVVGRGGVRARDRERDRLLEPKSDFLSHFAAESAFLL